MTFSRCSSAALAAMIGFAALAIQSAVAAEDTNSPQARALGKADKLFKEQNWAEARAAYEEVSGRETNWSAPVVRSAIEGAVACSMKLQQWDDALERAGKFIARTKGTFEEAVGERFLAGLYSAVPHHGTKRGTTLLRGQWTQGVQVYTWKKDRKEAIGHYERAREILMGMGKVGERGGKERPTPDRASPEKNARSGVGRSDTVQAREAEWIGVDFDLAAVLARHSEYGYWGGNWFDWWWGGWGEAEEDSAAVEEADYEEARWGRGWGGWGGEDQPTPTGIPVGRDGKPQFMATPKEYSAELGDGPKIRFLLEEIQRLDKSENQDDAAQALFRWAMLARSLYGPDSATAWSASRVRYDRFGQALPAEPGPEKPLKKVWELADDEALTGVGGRLQVVTLPKSESPMALLHEVEAKYPKSSIRPEAHYARALYLQTRQQFPQAVKEYQALRETYRKHKRAGDALQQLGKIEHPEIIFGQTGVYLPDQKPKLSFTYRNAGKTEFKAFRIDLAKYVQDRAEENDEKYWWQYRNLQSTFFQEDKWKKYLGENMAEWSETIPREPDNRVAEGSTLALLNEPGAYLVEARVPGGGAEPTRVLVLVTDIAIVQKNLTQAGLIYICDARTGQPIAEKAVRIYEHWQVYNQAKSKSDFFWDSTTRTTDARGVIEYKRKHQDQGSTVDAVVIGEKGRMAFSFFQNWSDSSSWSDYMENGPRYYVVTDRPVYRPGAKVQFRIWIRQVQERTFTQPHAGDSVAVQIYDAKNNLAQELTLKTDEFGGASGEYQLGAEPPLGVYHLSVNGYRPDARHNAGALFRVEEYEKPEFEVSVKPAKSQARLGEKIKARIEARYYFGAPVAKAKVTYKIFREDYHHVYFGPAECDWLYGKGYGRSLYAYSWLPWWHRWGGFICGDDWWQRPGSKAAWYFPWGYYGDDEGNGSRRYESGTRKALRELVSQGEGELAPDGSFELEIDTSRAKAELNDRDHRYTVEAEVRDASRRTIQGSGGVLATRQEFYAFVEGDRGWYQPGNEAFVEVRMLTPNNEPVTTKGEVSIRRISYDNGGQAREEIIKRWDAETDAQGRLSFRYAGPEEGQYRITYTTRDSVKEEVLGNAVFWVNGPKFDGRVYRFNDLEIVADKRTYKLGDVAHLLVNVAENDCHILFSDHVSQVSLLDYRFIDIPSRSTVIDVPIEQKHVPNFFVEATLVRNGRIHTEPRELFVPPVHGLLNVTLTSDKGIYKPGETGKVSVAVSDAAGKPVSGQVTLTAYDQSLTYIQDEFGPSPRVFFYGQKRYHHPQVDCSVNHNFSAWGTFERPENTVYLGGEPEGWHGTWNLETISLDESGASGERKQRLGFDRESGLKSESASRLVNSVSGGAGGAMLGPRGGAFDRKDKSFVFADALSINGSGANRERDLMKAAKEPAGGGKPLVEPELRLNFADTALWFPALALNASGKAETEITFPQSLTTWRLRGYALTGDTKVGDATAEAKTTKNLIVMLESPRFFVERDEVVLSANVHNYLKRAKKVRAELIVPEDLFESAGSGGDHSDKEGNRHFFAEAQVKADGEHRFDWPVKVRQAGLARITVKALTDEESDGMRLAFPVLVHGINKTVAQSGAYRVAQEGGRTLTVELPKDVDPEQTRLEVTLSPSLAGVMIDALPYLAGYPYGCVEQTMSRFYPSVLVADTLKKMGTDLESIGNQRRQMNAGDLQNRFGHGESPVFNSVELDRMVKAGLERIYAFQHSDGGWGWWREDDSSPYQSAYVLQGLHAALAAGVKVDRGIYDRGFQFLQNAISKELDKPKDQRQIGDFTTQAYLAYILALEHRLSGDEQKKWLDSLYAQRGELNNYGRALLALACHNEQRVEEAKTLLRNLLQFVERDDSNETAWVRTPQNYWWFWWNNDIEANAWALKALVTLDPKSDLAPRLVKWLLNNRRNGHYWRSTRDTALVIAAMTDYMRASGEAAPDYTLTLMIDGQSMKEIKLSKTNFFTFDNLLVLSGLHIKPGVHKIELTKNGQGALYYSAYLSYFTKEEDVRGAGNEIFVTREYFKLVPKTETVRLANRALFSGVRPSPGAATSKTRTSPRKSDALTTSEPAAPGDGRTPPDTSRTELRDGYTRVPLKNGDTLASGDKLEVVLKITAKNTYDYLAFEDMKPAGCELMELRSGGRWAGGLCANMELRDEKVVFFIGLLEQGEHVLRYKLRAETPGHFHALPAKGFAMYAPEVKAISDEMRLRIRE